MIETILWALVVIILGVAGLSLLFHALMLLLRIPSWLLEQARKAEETRIRKTYRN